MKPTKYVSYSPLYFLSCVVAFAITCGGVFILPDTQDRLIVRFILIMISSFLFSRLVTMYIRDKMYLAAMDTYILCTKYRVDGHVNDESSLKHTFTLTPSEKAENTSFETFADELLRERVNRVSLFEFTRVRLLSVIEKWMRDSYFLGDTLVTVRDVPLSELNMGRGDMTELLMHIEDVFGRFIKPINLIDTRWTIEEFANKLFNAQID